MKNKRGFTLMELLCVIVILSLIAVVASPGVMMISKNVKKNLYCTKIQLIKSSALDYARDHEREINESTKLFLEHKMITIKIKDLLDNNYLTADKNGDLLNPIDNLSMNDTEIILYLENNQVNAYIDTDNVC